MKREMHNLAGAFYEAYEGFHRRYSIGSRASRSVAPCGWLTPRQREPRGRSCRWSELDTASRHSLNGQRVDDGEKAHRRPCTSGGWMHR